MNMKSPIVKPRRKPASIRLLRVVSRLLPGDRLKTLVYLNFIRRPRKIIRSLISDFYRMDHIYNVIGEFVGNYHGRFSILEFGVAEGYSFVKILYATRYLKCEDRVTVHGFDTFEGMPKAAGACDRGLIAADSWVEGQFDSDYSALHDYCAARYRNFELHKGMFEDTLTPELLATLRDTPPILVWIDCDYYSSARSAFVPIMELLPSGCVIYFDEPEFNYGSRFTGEARLIHEINTGVFGDGIELIPDPELSLNTSRVYRFINVNAPSAYRPLEHSNTADARLQRGNGSPFP